MNNYKFNTTTQLHYDKIYYFDTNRWYNNKIETMNAIVAIRDIHNNNETIIMDTINNIIIPHSRERNNIIV